MNNNFSRTFVQNLFKFFINYIECSSRWKTKQNKNGKPSWPRGSGTFTATVLAGGKWGHFAWKIDVFHYCSVGRTLNSRGTTATWERLSVFAQNPGGPTWPAYQIPSVAGHGTFADARKFLVWRRTPPAPFSSLGGASPTVRAQPMTPTKPATRWLRHHPPPDSRSMFGHRSELNRRN